VYIRVDITDVQGQRYSKVIRSVNGASILVNNDIRQIHFGKVLLHSNVDVIMFAEILTMIDGALWH
jgi:hypothetical protein